LDLAQLYQEFNEIGIILNITYLILL